MSGLCWRGECRDGCYYPDVCSEAATPFPGLHACECCGLELDADDPLTRCEDCRGAARRRWRTRPIGGTS